MPEKILCPHCNAPASYLYYNDGQKCSQIRCKICGYLGQIQKRFRSVRKAKYWCPHCDAAMYLWKQQNLMTIYKCPNDHCPAYLEAKNKLSPQEKTLQKQRSSQFKLRYQYRECHFSEEQLKPSAPEASKVDLANIHHSPNLLGLVLALHISFAISARKTALMLKQIFKIKISYQPTLSCLSQRKIAKSQHIMSTIHETRSRQRWP